MASAGIKQVKCGVESSFLNLDNASGRVPGDSGVSYSGLSCANPKITPDFTVTRNESVTNKFFGRAPGIALRPGKVAFDLYMRGCGADESFADPTFAVFDALFGKQSTSNADYIVESWDSTTQATLDSVTNLAAGQGFAVTIDGRTHVSFIRSIAQAQKQITFYPPLPDAITTEDPIPYIRGGRTYAVGRDFKDGTSLAFQILTEAYTQKAFGCQGSAFNLNLVTGEMATAGIELAAGYVEPNGAPSAVGATEEPAGSWVKFLNALCLFDGAQVDCRSVNWKVDLQPKRVVSPHNAAGLSDFEMGKCTITADVELSAYDTNQFPAFLAGTEFSLLCVMGTGEDGSGVAIYAPAMHQTAVPSETETDDLIGQTLSLEAGNTEAEGGDFDSASTNVIDTIFRVFFERG